MYPTVRQLRAFLSVAECGSFRSAGERLNMTQPALSNLVKDLEEDLGLRLFDRTTRRVELTQAGQEFRGSVEKVLTELEGAVRRARDTAQKRRGRITVAAPPLLAAAILPGAIAALRDALPGIAVTLIDGRSDLIVEKVRESEIDCALGTYSAEEDGISRTLLARDHIMAFFRADSPFAKVSPLRWSDLRDTPLVTLTKDSGVRALVDAGFESMGGPRQPEFEVNHITTALALADAGLGVALLPTYATRAARTYTLSARSLTDPMINRDICVIYPAGRSRPPAIEPFVAMLRVQISAFGKQVG